MSDVLLIDQNMLGQLAAEAASAPRLRKNRNFHQSNEDLCHRMLNALQPGTYVQPHRHLDAVKEETILVLSGRFGCLVFDDNGKVVQACELSAGGAAMGINIKPGTFHSIVALAPNSVFFESKQGPYTPIAEAEKAAWAPAEGAPECAAYLTFMLSHFA
ncbi:cupin fold WbuC family metalloprotein [Silvimonas terrae]|uniref:Cupin fold WbuC family metalloprotein n=1 Tax=Silvimonas terrae TaxID=300266 RepID=A0A840RMQ8_9NEIS|nr:WbuC family cupin fold metalloprotein [Silvimonas terrae]MBB5193453.1 cupin fold WbuC family metalloprotein [Silvimonas terrae]